MASRWGGSQKRAQPEANGCVFFAAAAGDPLSLQIVTSDTY
ncbi:hypothetical protein LT85_2426 [Collimonas arenae]|uniref:Uncharacterized protein n=1 Tax=Collimonas arenae TaxID=279058 RepID=A0A0A1FD29_9BURK|nr:hypothetical protein LT85_2426 [Collimonas arenae]